jgi:mRNA-degrading endonuclease RelE of RelBE toxin-antitoxin system
VTRQDGHRLDLKPRARRQLADTLPESVAAAALEFILGPLLDNPRRVGKPLTGRYEGQYSSRRGPAWRIRYQIDEAGRTVTVLDVSHRSDTYGT